MIVAESSKRAVRTAAGYHPLVVVFAAFALGIVADRYVPLPVPLWWWGSAAALAGWWYLWRQQRDAAAGIALLIAVALFGGARHHTSWSSYSQSDIALPALEEGRPVCLEAIALEAPRRLPAPPFTPLRAYSVGERSRLAIRACQLRDGTQWRPITGEALLTVDGHLSGLQAGDRVQVFGRISAPRPAQNPGQFDFARHERASGRLAQVWTTFPQCVSHLEPGRGLSPARWIDGARSHSAELLERYVRPEQLGLASTLVLGKREQLDFERNEQFLETGTIHVLAISGLHVGMVAASVFALLRMGWLPRSAALWGVILVTIGYALLTDSGAPVMRATLLVVLGCLALWQGRSHSMFNALAAAALLLACLHPADVFRTGPQLSFLSVTAIFWIAPRLASLGRIDDPLDRLIAQTRAWWIRWARFAGLRVTQTVLFSAAIWLATCPIVLSQFHVLSPIAIGLNLFLWIPVAIALISGLGVIATGWLFAPAALLCGAVCSTSLAAMERAVAWGSQLPAGHFWLPGPAGWWLIGLYGMAAVWAAASRWRPPVRWQVALLAAWVACGLFASPRAGQLAQAARLPAPIGNTSELRCTFLSVGHGLAVVLELPSGEVLLYDAGQLGSPTAAARTVAGYLWSRGITHIDAVAISHADLDHFNAVPALAERFSLGVTYTSPMMFEEQAASLRALSQALAEHAVPIEVLVAGDRLQTAGGCQIDVLHPTREGVLGSDNANSLVLAVEYAGRRILLTGDLESPGLEAVLAELPYDCDVLLAPHHGSVRSNPRGMAEWSQPEHVIISGGYEVDPLVFDAYQQAGAEVLHTATAGAISVIVNGGDLHIETFRPARHAP